LLLFHLVGFVVPGHHLSDLLADKIEASEIKKIPPQEKKKEGERRASTSSREGKNNLASL
jgi:hypothetical protein